MKNKAFFIVISLMPFFLTSCLGSLLAVSRNPTGVARAVMNQGAYNLTGANAESIRSIDNAIRNNPNASNLAELRELRKQVETDLIEYEQNNKSVFSAERESSSFDNRDAQNKSSGFIYIQKDAEGNVIARGTVNSAKLFRVNIESKTFNSEVSYISSPSNNLIEKKHLYIPARNIKQIEAEAYVKERNK